MIEITEMEIEDGMNEISEIEIEGGIVGIGGIVVADVDEEEIVVNDRDK